METGVPIVLCTPGILHVTQKVTILYKNTPNLRPKGCW